MTQKVVHISTVHSPHDPRIYHKQCRTLAKAGFDVTLICPHDGEFQPEDGVKAILLPKPKTRKERMTTTQRQAYQEARKLEADVYCFHDPELIFLGRKLKNKNNVVIYDIHEDYETAMGQKQYLPGPLAPLAAFTYRNLTKLLTRDFALSLAEKYYKEKFPRGKCILNYPFLSGRQKKAERKEEDKYRLLYTGNVTAERGAYIHARLPELDDEVSVTYVGKCAKEIGDKIYSISKRNSITGLDHYVPWQDIEDAYFDNNWLAGLALFPATEHYKKKELTKFFEYMYAEIPILCSDFPAWKEFVETHKCGIAVDPNDDEAILQALNFLKYNPETASEMGKNGREAVIRELNWHAEAKKLVDWYNNLLPKNP